MGKSIDSEIALSTCAILGAYLQLVRQYIYLFFLALDGDMVRGILKHLTITLALTIAITLSLTI